MSKSRLIKALWGAGKGSSSKVPWSAVSGPTKRAAGEVVEEAAKAPGAYGRADQWTSTFFKNRFRDFKNAPPAMKALGVLGGADIGLMAAGGAADMFQGSKIGKALGYGDDGELAVLLEQTKRAELLRAYKQATENQRIEQNAMELARRAPDLFESVMAGRQLPRDGVAIGGTPRIDLLEQVAALMGSGAGVPDRQDPNEFLNALMGG